MLSQASYILILEDNEDRISRFTMALRAIDPSLQIIHWRSAKKMIAEVDSYLPKARLISLVDFPRTSGHSKE